VIGAGLGIQVRGTLRQTGSSREPFAKLPQLAKTIGGSLLGSVTTWAFSVHGRRGIQDHPVFILRAVRCPRCMAAEHLFGRSVLHVRADQCCTFVQRGAIRIRSSAS